MEKYTDSCANHSEISHAPIYVSYILPSNSVTRNIIISIFIQHDPHSIIFKTIRKIPSDWETSFFKGSIVLRSCRLEHFTRQSNHIVECVVLSTELECSAIVPRQFELSRYVNSIETRESFTYPASIHALSVGGPLQNLSQ